MPYFPCRYIALLKENEKVKQKKKKKQFPCYPEIFHILINRKQFPQETLIRFRLERQKA